MIFQIIKQLNSTISSKLKANKNNYKISLSKLIVVGIDLCVGLIPFDTLASSKEKGVIIKQDHALSLSTYVEWNA
jgi:hypothetical protein